MASGPYFCQACGRKTSYKAWCNACCSATCEACIERGYIPEPHKPEDHLEGEPNNDERQGNS